MPNNAVHRVSVEVLDSQTLTLTGPPISVGAGRERWADQGGYYDLWFEHVEDVEPRQYVIYTLGTGHPAPWPNVMERSAYRFIGTVIYPRLVWHVYLYIPEVAQAWKNSLAALNPDAIEAGSITKSQLPGLEEADDQL